MDWIHMTAEDDLRWYYQQAASECGFWSSTGGVLARCESLSKCKKGPEGGIKLHETRSSNRDNCPEDRRIDAFGRERKINATLSTLPASARTVLELHYSGGVMLLDVTLALAASLPITRTGHAKANAEQRKAEDRRRADLAHRKTIGAVARNKPTPKPKKARVIHDKTTPRDWLLYLCATNPSGDQLKDILQAAREALAKALESYVAAARKAA